MVATRRSLGGGGGYSPSPSPAADTEPLTKAQQAQLKKLNISGTDALKGEDLKAVQAARENLPTYHWRGASYLQDENTDAAWVDNQPERYLKRSREAGLDDGEGVEGRTATAVEEEDEDDEDEDEEDEEEEDEEDEEEEDEEDEEEDEDEDEDEEEEEEEEEAPPLKRRKFEQDHELEPYIEAIRKSHADRLHARAARSERLQKPSREEAAAAVATSSPSSAKKASKIAEDTADNNMNTARSDNAENGRGKKRTRKHSAIDDEETEQPATKSRASQNEVHARSLPSSADIDRIDKEKKRSKKEAARKNLKTKPLREEDMYSEGEQRRQKVVKLAEVQKELIETTEDWHFAKEQLEKARAYNAARRAAQQAGAQDTQQPIDLSEDATEHDNRDEDMVDEQLEREQQQHSGSASQDQHDDGSKAVDTPLDEVNDEDSGVNAVTEAEHDLYASTDAYEQHQQIAYVNMAPLSEAHTHLSEMSPPPQTTSGASRTSPSATLAETPIMLMNTTTTSTYPTGASTKPGHTPTAPAPLDTPSSNSSANSSNDSKTSTTSAERNTFASLPPGAELPTTSAGGDPLRWTIQQRLSAETGRDQYALDMGRLQGETKQARRRRIARERAVVGSWAKITGADIVELKAAGSED